MTADLPAPREVENGDYGVAGELVYQIVIPLLLLLSSAVETGNLVNQFVRGLSAGHTRVATDIGGQDRDQLLGSATRPE